MRVLAIIFSIILAGTIFGIQESFAEQASGKPAWETNSDKVCGDKLCSELYSKQKSETTILPPLKQFKNGISPPDTVCKEGLELWFRKTPFTEPLCITEETAKKWLSRNRNVIDFSSTVKKSKGFFQSIDQRYLEENSFCKLDSDCLSGGSGSGCSVPEPHPISNKFWWDAHSSGIITVKNPPIYKFGELQKAMDDLLKICHDYFNALPTKCEMNTCIVRYGYD